MEHTIEYSNEFGLMMKVKDGQRLVYQDTADEDYTWLNVKIDKSIALFIDLTKNQVSYNKISELIGSSKTISSPF